MKRLMIVILAAFVLIITGCGGSSSQSKIDEVPMVPVTSEFFAQVNSASKTLYGHIDSLLVNGSVVDEEFEYLVVNWDPEYSKIESFVLEFWGSDNSLTAAGPNGEVVSLVLEEHRYADGWVGELIFDDGEVLTTYVVRLLEPDMFTNLVMLNDPFTGYDWDGPGNWDHESEHVSFYVSTSQYTDNPYDVAVGAHWGQWVDSNNSEDYVVHFFGQDISVYDTSIIVTGEMIKGHSVKQPVSSSTEPVTLSSGQTGWFSNDYDFYVKYEEDGWLRFDGDYYVWPVAGMPPIPTYNGTLSITAVDIDAGTVTFTYEQEGGFVIEDPHSYYGFELVISEPPSPGNCYQSTLTVYDTTGPETITLPICPTPQASAGGGGSSGGGGGGS
ncbi:hypothetical protein GOV04_02120 [Candidatus Woesearchaeota archaeon]|nr:hypothetical protein [Candidatus Woesearchaeota archaeon]